MKTRISILALVAATVASLTLLTGCAEGPPPGAVYVNVPPPAAQVEVIGTAPGPGFVWIGGFHRWNGSAYVWAPGRWEARPRPNARWVGGGWVHHKKGWYYREGRWR